MANQEVWHPLAEKFPDITGEEWERFKEGIKRSGGIDRQPILYRVKGDTLEKLDGRQRERACRELKIKPTMKRVTVRDDEVIDFISECNLNRRHSDAGSRQAIAAAMRSEGASINTIAEKLDVNPKTVRADLQTVEEKTGQKIEPKEIQGKDKRKYKVRKPGEHGDADEGPVLCDRCQRTGAVTNCPKCKEAANKAAAKRAAKVKAKASKNGAPTVDWRLFRDGFGLLIRTVDRIGNVFKVKETPKAQALRDRLGKWQDDVKEWHKALANKAGAAK
jgi:DNA-binding CsgD family transcriptional regulator